MRRHIPETPELRYLRQVSENVHQTSVGIMRMAPIDTARAFQHLVTIEPKLGPLPEDGDIPGRLSTRDRGGDLPRTGPTAHGSRHLPHEHDGHGPRLPEDGDLPARLSRRDRGGATPRIGSTADQGQSRVAGRLGLHHTTIQRYLGFLSSDTPAIIRDALELDLIGPAVAAVGVEW